MSEDTPTKRGKPARRRPTPADKPEVEAPEVEMTTEPVAQPAGDPVLNAKKAELKIDSDEAKIHQAELLKVYKARKKAREKYAKDKKAGKNPVFTQQTTSPRDTLTAQLRDAGVVAEDEDLMFDDQSQHQKHVNMGWEPVMVRGRHQMDRGDLAYKRDREIGTLIKGENYARARAMMADVGDDMEDAISDGVATTENKTGYSPGDWE